MSDYNQYESIFEPELKIDVANYLAELVIVNFLNWQKKPIPKSPFWRKSISGDNTYLKQLAQRYTVELSGMKDLLEVFAPQVLAEYFRETKTVGFKLVKAETKQRILMELFKKQVLFIRSLENIQHRAVELANDKKPFMGTFTFVPKKNIIGGL